jgi:cytochrome c oxidase subunit II
VRHLATLLALLGCLVSCGDTTPHSTQAVVMTASMSGAPSAEIWQTQCAACHGDAGQGIQAVGAPALTQLSEPYLARQLTHFVEGIRGTHPDDSAGKRMALSVANVAQDDIPGLVSLITTQLPPTTSTTTVAGNPARGEDYYVNLCSACHGGNALGNDTLGAPALAGVSDWYLRTAYQAFLDGLRGQHPDDSYGAQMARLAPALDRQDDIDDVIAFIATLPPHRTR